jgi:putative hydrolase of the HAD superfamily
MAKPLGLLFDLDDTLVPEMEHEYAALKFVCEIVAERHPQVNAAKLRDSLDRNAQQLWSAAGTPGKYDSISYSAYEGLWGPPDLPAAELDNDADALTAYRKKAWDEVLAEFGIIDPQLRDDVIQRQYDERIRQLIPYPGVPTLLEKLAVSYKLGVVTNGSPAVQRFKLRRSGLSEYFDSVVASGDVGVGKPNPEPFTSALSQLSLDPTQAIMIGNSLTSDIAGALALGIRSVWVSHGDELSSNDPQPDWIVQSVTEVEGLELQF